VKWPTIFRRKAGPQVAATTVESSTVADVSTAKGAGGTRISHSFFPEYPKPLVRADLTDQVFEDLNAHKRELRNGDLSYSVFRRGYFRDAVFRNCTFRGARFEDCTFRGARFFRSEALNSSARLWSGI